MKIHVFPPSGRIVGIVAFQHYLALDCELKAIDLGTLAYESRSIQNDATGPTPNPNPLKLLATSGSRTSR